MKQMIRTTVFASCLLVFGGAANAKTIRATDLGSTDWAALVKSGDTIVEFHQGDSLPVTLAAEGDLIETTQLAASYVSVKRNFWVRLQQNNVQISLDGNTFKNISDVLSGSVEAGAGQQNGGVADAINVAFKAYLK